MQQIVHGFSTIALTIELLLDPKTIRKKNYNENKSSSPLNAFA